MHALGVFTRRVHHFGQVSLPSLARFGLVENDLRRSHDALFPPLGRASPGVARKCHLPEIWGTPL